MGTTDAEQEKFRALQAQASQWQQWQMQQQQWQQYNQQWYTYQQQLQQWQTQYGMLFYSNELFIFIRNKTCGFLFMPMFP